MNCTCTASPAICRPHHLPAPALTASSPGTRPDRIISRHPPGIEYPMVLTVAGTADKQEDAEAADKSLSVSPFHEGMLCDSPTSAHDTVTTLQQNVCRKLASKVASHLL
jgi:hypothetical protein